YAIEPPWEHAPALLGGDPAARMLNEPDTADRIIAEVDRREVLAALVAIVVRRHDAQRRAVREAQRLAVEAIGEQHVRSQGVRDRQHAEESAVEAAEDHIPRAGMRSRARRDEPLKHVSEPDAAPAKPDPAPRCDAVEVRDLIDARKRGELGRLDLGGRFHVAADAQHEAVGDDRAHTDVSTEARELANGALTRRERGHAPTINRARSRE